MSLINWIQVRLAVHLSSFPSLPCFTIIHFKPFTSGRYTSTTIVLQRALKAVKDTVDCCRLKIFSGPRTLWPCDPKTKLKFYLLKVKSYHLKHWLYVMFLYSLFTFWTFILIKSNAVKEMLDWKLMNVWIAHFWLI